MEVLQRKKNIRVLICRVRRCAGSSCGRSPAALLLQQRDAIDADGDDPANWTLAAGEAADAQTLADLEFAWRACRAVKSNAILLAHGRRLGRRRYGAGQPGRRGAARGPAGRRPRRGSVAASDAFFPFPDGPQVLLSAGVKAVVQPGGSVRDNETIDAAREAGCHAVPHRFAALRALISADAANAVWPLDRCETRGHTARGSTVRRSSPGGVHGQSAVPDNVVGSSINPTPAQVTVPERVRSRR